MEFFSSTFFLTVILPVIILVIGKLAPNDKIKGWGEALGVLCTAGMSRLAPVFWGKIEEYFINGIMTFVEGFIKGLRSDNKAKSNAK